DDLGPQRLKRRQIGNGLDLLGGDEVRPQHRAVQLHDLGLVDEVRQRLRDARNLAQRETDSQRITLQHILRNRVAGLLKRELEQRQLRNDEHAVCIANCAANLHHLLVRHAPVIGKDDGPAPLEQVNVLLNQCFLALPCQRQSTLTSFTPHPAQPRKALPPAARRLAARGASTVNKQKIFARTGEDTAVPSRRRREMAPVDPWVRRVFFYLGGQFSGLRGR